MKPTSNYVQATPSGLFVCKSSGVAIRAALSIEEVIKYIHGAFYTTPSDFTDKVYRSVHPTAEISRRVMAHVLYEVYGLPKDTVLKITGYKDIPLHFMYFETDEVKSVLEYICGDKYCKPLPKRPHSYDLELFRVVKLQNKIKAFARTYEKEYTVWLHLWGCPPVPFKDVYLLTPKPAEFHKLDTTHIENRRNKQQHAVKEAIKLLEGFKKLNNVTNQLKKFI